MDPNTSVQDLLDSISETGPEHAQYLREWEHKSPAQKVVAARKAFYGIVEPSLISGEQLTSEQLGELEAIFEGCFKTVEQTSMQKGRRVGSGSP